MRCQAATAKTTSYATQPAGVEVVNILDFRHLQQHIWGAAKASWGDGSSRTKTWSKKQIDTVLEKKIYGVVSIGKLAGDTKATA